LTVGRRKPEPGSSSLPIMQRWLLRLLLARPRAEYPVLHACGSAGERPSSRQMWTFTHLLQCIVMRTCPARNSIAWLICADACGWEAVMVGWPGADQDHLSDGSPCAALAVLVFRKELAKEAELLVLRHENAVLRRHAGRIRYEPADRVWFTALTRLIPRRRWAGSFP
jgi:hypothetical protein